MDDRSDLPAIRVSDEERERSVVLLRDAVVSGRLTLEEFSERVGRAQLARTDRDPAELTVDLPAHAPAHALVPHAKHRAICSKLVRRGSWEIPERSSWRSLFGTIVLDLREARLAGPAVELDIRNTFGTVTVLVPAGIQLDVEGTAPFASQVIEPLKRGSARLPPRAAPRAR